MKPRCLLIPLIVCWVVSAQTNNTGITTLVTFESGTVGQNITAADVMGSTHGIYDGAVVNGGANSMFTIGSANGPTVSYTVTNASFDGTGTRSLRINHNVADYDKYLNFKFNEDLSGNTATNIGCSFDCYTTVAYTNGEWADDLVNLSPFLVCQLKLTASGANFVAHADGSNGENVAISTNEWYHISMFAKSGNTESNVIVAVYRWSDKSLVGTSYGRYTGTGRYWALIGSEYELSPNGGYSLIDNLALKWDQGASAEFPILPWPQTSSSATTTLSGGTLTGATFR